MKIIRTQINDLSASEVSHIESFIEDNSGLIFHSPELNRIAARYAGTELEYWLAYDKGSLVALLPVHLIRRGILKHYISGLTTFEIPFGGWVLGHKMDVLSLSSRLKLKYNESLLISTSFLGENTYGEQGMSRETAVIDFVNTNIEGLWNRIDSKRRNMIRKAEKSGIIVLTLDQSDISDFYELLMQMNRRTGLISKEELYYKNIYSAYGFEKSCIMVAYMDKVPISAIMLVGNHNAWHYWQGATDTAFNVGAGELLQWKGIQYAFNQGTKLYDTCVIDRQKLPGLAAYKLSFGAEPRRYGFVTNRPLSARLINKLYNRSYKRS